MTAGTPHASQAARGRCSSSAVASEHDAQCVASHPVLPLLTPHGMSCTALQPVSFLSLEDALVMGTGLDVRHHNVGVAGG